MKPEESDRRKVIIFPGTVEGSENRAPAVGKKFSPHHAYVSTSTHNQQQPCCGRRRCLTLPSGVGDKGTGPPPHVLHEPFASRCDEGSSSTPPQARDKKRQGKATPTKKTMFISGKRGGFVHRSPATEKLRPPHRAGEDKRGGRTVFVF